MSYNGSGTFTINTTGQPVVAGTIISASAFNSLTTDLATGLTTAITKDGQTTTTARITFAQGVTSSLVTDSSSVSTGSIITAGGVGVAKALYVGTTANFAGVVTLTAQPILSSLTASKPVFTDASKGLVSTGTLGADQGGTGVANNVAATVTSSGNFAYTRTLTGATNVTLPTTGTLATLAGTETLTNKTLTTPTISSLSSASATALTLQSAGTTAITVNTSQQVGIGGTPVKTLSILPTSIRRMDFYVRDPGVDDALVIRSQNATLNNIRDMILEGSILRFFTGAESGGSGTESMRIDSSGFLLYNTTSTTVASASTANTGGINFRTSGASGNGVIDIARTSDFPLNLNRLSTTGGVVNIAYNGSTVGTISTNGTTTAYNTSSDYRLKENIVPMTGALAKVALLKPVTYRWKKDQSDGEGFIAHELAEVCPHAVSGDKDATREEEYEVTPAVKDGQGNITTPAVIGTRTVPDYQGIDVSFLVATLTAAIQEQQAIITALTARITALENA